MTYDGGEPVSTGVGLSNIRDRLSQAYGENHRFETIEPPEGGFAVVIEIPFEQRETAEERGEAPRLAASAFR
jgi:sensor histidine kinase YesM